MIRLIKSDAVSYSESFSRVDPIEALADLRKRIQKALATRYLVREEGKLTPTHARLKGRTTDGGVVVDGLFIQFDELAVMLQAYDGFQFDLRLFDADDEL